jgi:hypothetical protein
MITQPTPTSLNFICEHFINILFFFPFHQIQNDTKKLMLAACFLSMFVLFSLPTLNTKYFMILFVFVPLVMFVLYQLK